MIAAMIMLFTDFGWAGPYVGEIKAVLAARAPGILVIDLMHDAPAFEPRLAAYLLAAVVRTLPAEAVILGVIDPEVGSPSRRPVVVQSGARYFVGPDNGLFQIAARAAPASWWEITWRPERLSRSFHGRDLFAPVAAILAEGGAVPGTSFAGTQAVGADWPADHDQIVYIDGFGNAMTGLRAESVPADAILVVTGKQLARAGTFSDVATATPFWYVNSAGLIEIAVNRGRADHALGLVVGTPVTVRAVA